MADDRNDEDLKAKLSPEQYAIACGEGTERPFSNPLNNEKRSGLYKCAGCGEVLFVSDHKYDSGSGWPSFYETAEQGVLGTKTDYKVGVARTEVHCAKCGSHMGHVFADGPQDKTGLRYCINGAVLNFEPEES